MKLWEREFEPEHLGGVPVNERTTTLLMIGIYTVLATIFSLAIWKAVELAWAVVRSLLG